MELGVCGRLNSLTTKWLFPPKYAQYDSVVLVFFEQRQNAKADFKGSVVHKTLTLLL